MEIKCLEFSCARGGLPKMVCEIEQQVNMIFIKIGHFLTYIAFINIIYFITRTLFFTRLYWLLFVTWYKITRQLLCNNHHLH